MFPAKLAIYMYPSPCFCLREADGAGPLKSGSVAESPAEGPHEQRHLGSDILRPSSLVSCGQLQFCGVGGQAVGDSLGCASEATGTMQ